MIIVESKAMHVLNFVSLTVTTLNLSYSINNKIGRPNKLIIIRYNSSVQAWPSSSITQNTVSSSPHNMQLALVR